MRRWAMLEDGAIGYRMAEADDVDLDAFSCGDDAFSVEVADYLKSRRWMDPSGKAKPPVYQFGNDREVVGYAAAAFANRPHPDDTSLDRARYFTIFVMGVHQRLRGAVNPASPVAGERFAATVFRALEAIARTKVDCVGLALWVRENNTRAVAFYSRLGFVTDPRGPFDDGGHPTLSMRKFFRNG
jgi:ribosomal protein S18 acetylase RimI-like enzyme